MNVLHLALLAPGSPQLGLRRALRSVADEYRELDWLPLWEAGRAAEVRARFVEEVRALRPGFVFAQLQTPGVLTPAELAAVPCPVVSWCGDVRRTTPPWAVELAPHVVSCFSNERDVAAVRALGHRAEYLNIGVSLEVFCPVGDARPGTPPVVFMGNQTGDAFPLGGQRRQMVEALRRRYGSRFAVYGRGWGGGAEWLDEPAEAAAYRGCRVAVGQNHFADVPRFASDRLFRATASGAFLVHNHYPGIERDVTPGEHVAVWHDLDGLFAEIDRHLDDEPARSRIARAGCAHVRANHSWDARMLDLRRILATHAPAVEEQWAAATAVGGGRTGGRTDGGGAAVDPLEAATAEWCAFPQGFNGDGFIAAEVRRLVRGHAVSVAIETGTYEGKTTEALAAMVPQVITVENDDRFWPLADHLAALPNVRRVRGDSPQVLRDLLPQVAADSGDRRGGRLFVYLDAHWGTHSPLLDELAAVADAGLRPIIAIHDFHNPDHPEYGYDAYDIGPYRWETIAAHVRAIYGDGGWRHWHNGPAAGAKRGIVYIEPARSTFS